MAQQKLYEVEAEGEARNLEKSDIAFYAINQEFESQRLSYIKQVGGQIRLGEIKSACYGKLDLRNRLFQRR